MSRYNRLSRPIAVMGYRHAYMHLCEFTGVNPHSTDLFAHISTPEDVNGEYCRLIEIDGASETRHYNFVKSLVMARIRNEARATKIDPRNAD